MEPGQPIPVTCPASSEAIDALLGTKGRSPRVVPDETKLAITNRASRGSATSKTFGAVQHCSLLLVLSSLFVDHPSFTVALHEPVRFSNVCSSLRTRERYANATYSSTSPQRWLSKERGVFANARPRLRRLMQRGTTAQKPNLRKVRFWPRKAAIPTSVASGQGL